MKYKDFLQTVFPTSCKLRQGFTIVELVVTVGIFMAITGVVVANYPKLNSKLSIDLLAHDIAISIRQAQSYALSVRTPVGQLFKAAYGMHLAKDPNNPNNPQNKEFLFFADVPPTLTGDSDRVYIPKGTNGSIDAVVQTYTMQGSHSFSTLCVKVGGSVCSEQPIVAVDITFKRPDPEAKILGLKADGSYTAEQDEAQLCISSADGSYTQRIQIFQSGQIGVSAVPCL